jgi:glutamyl-tRNA reductase
MTTEAAVEEVDVDAGTARSLDARVREGTRDCAWDVIDAIHDEAERIREREVDEAVRRLEAHGDLTERQRDIVESMAHDIFDRLLEPATKHLVTAAVDEEPCTVDAARKVFDVDFDADSNTQSAPRANGSTITEVTSDGD